VSGAVTVTRQYADGTTSTFEANDSNELCRVVSEDQTINPVATLYTVATKEDAIRLGGVDANQGRWRCGPWICEGVMLWIDSEVTS
jgi:hypothetical protein